MVTRDAVGVYWGSVTPHHKWAGPIVIGPTSKHLSSPSTRLAHAARLGFFFFYKNELYKFTVITGIIIVSKFWDLLHARTQYEINNNQI